MSGMIAIDVSKLPKPNFVEVIDVEAILARRKKQLLDAAKATDETLYQGLLKVINLESEPLNIALQESAYEEMLLRQRVNEAALSTTKAFAVGTGLDTVAANDNLERRIVQEADNTVDPPIPLILESDDSLRTRAFLAADKITTAGSGESYRAWGLEASQKVKDIKVVSPKPMHITLYVLSTDGDGTADSELIKQVSDFVSGQKRRPLGDEVKVESVEVLHYDIRAAVEVNSLPEIEPILSASKASLSVFVSEKNQIGEPVYLSAINAAGFVEGVKRVKEISPATDLILKENQIGYCDSITVAPVNPLGAQP